MPTPLFASGTARGGTNLVTLILSVHPEISLSQDPYLPLFRSLRNSIVASSGEALALAGFDPDGPLDEYYYSENRLAVMRLVQAADLDLPFDPAELPRLKRLLESRASLSSPLLVPHIGLLQGDTYKALFESAIEIVGIGRQTPDVAWPGWIDNWTVEFFPAMARRFPEARFIIIIRDVRSSIASQLRLTDLTRVALPMSFVRCWRKQIALALHYREMELFRDRLHILTYEQLVRYPEQKTREMCEFVGVEYSPDMVDSTKFVGPDGGPWIPNSNYSDTPQQGIYHDSIDRWKKALPREVIRLIEFVAGPDLEMAGYALSEPQDSGGLDWDAYDRHVQDRLRYQGWRTDNGNPEIDFGLELLRRYCLEHQPEDPSLIERCFLFPEAYQNLAEGSPLFPATRKPVLRSDDSRRKAKVAKSD